MHRFVPTLAFVFSLAVLTIPAAAAFDLSGSYGVDISGDFELFDWCAWEVTQSEGDLIIVQTCPFAGGDPIVLSGTVDPSTGALSVLGEVCGMGIASASLSGNGSSDGLSISAAAMCEGIETTLNATKCGNGVADAGEACDDGNRSDGDCCSAQCEPISAGTWCRGDNSACYHSACDGAGACVADAEPLAAGSRCDLDDDACTVDECNGAGTCTATGSPLSCDACSICDEELGCIADGRPLTSTYPASAGECLVARGNRAKVSIRQKIDPEQNRLVADLRGLTFDADLADFGDPTESDGYQVCVFAPRIPDQVVRSIMAPERVAPITGWRTTATGFRYRSSGDGIQRLSLDVPGHTGKGRLRLNGKGEELGIPGLAVSHGGYDVPIVVEVRSDNGRCWAARFDAVHGRGRKLQARD
jgi:cysteine-rich repeat protein